MYKDRTAQIEWVKHFVKVCEKNKIWYAMGRETLLGVVRHSGLIPWKDDLEILMTPIGYEKLKRLFPENCVDGTTNEKYSLIFPKFIPDKNKIFNSAIFVNIFLIVPSSKKNIKKFKSLKNKTNFFVQLLYSKRKAHNFKTKLAKIVAYPIKPFARKLTYKDAVNILKEDKHTGFYVVTNPGDNAIVNWMQTFSFKTEKKMLAGIEVQVPHEWEEILISNYGTDYLQHTIPNKLVEHKNAIFIIKTKKN